MNFQLNKWHRRVLIGLGIAGYVVFTWAVIKIS
jgi:hypothetical protein